MAKDDTWELSFQVEEHRTETGRKLKILFIYLNIPTFWKGKGEPTISVACRSGRPAAVAADGRPDPPLRGAAQGRPTCARFVRGHGWNRPPPLPAGLMLPLSEVKPSQKNLFFLADNNAVCPFFWQSFFQTHNNTLPQFVVT